MGDAAIEVNEDEEVAVELKTIWDCDNVTLKPDDDGNLRWYCGWCGYSGAGKNATKALCHVLCKRGENVAICKRNLIADDAMMRYESLYNRQRRKQQGNSFIRDDHDNSLLTQSQEFASSIVSQRDSKKAKRMHPSGGSVGSSISSILPQSTNLNACSPPVPAINGPLLMKKAYSLQTTLTGINQEARDLCTAAVADCIHGLGLPFSLVDEPKFRHMLKMAKFVDKEYKPPTRKQIAGDLLD